MNGKYALIKKDWLLRGWENMPYAVANWKNGDFRELSKETFDILKYCDGKTDFSSWAYLPKARRILDKLIEEGIAYECEFGEELETLQAYKYAPSPVIRGLLWSVTGLCNLKCRHCFMEAPSGKYRELTFEEIKDLIKKFVDANIFEVALTGGEPFINKNLGEIAEILTENKIGLAEIFSNATLITESVLNQIERAGHRPYFKISFDGCNNHDFMRGVPGCEKETITGIKLLKAHNFPVTIISSLDRITWEDILETYELLKTLEVDGWWLAPPVEIGEWKKQEKSFTTDDMLEISQKLLKLWLADKKPFDLKLWRFGLFSKNETEEDKKMRRKSLYINADSFNCLGTHTRPYLMPDGTLIPCGGYTGTKMQVEFPNVLESSLVEAWSALSIRKICDMTKNDVIAENLSCKDCEYFKECGSGCRVVALTETGNLMSKDPVACMLFRGGYIKRFREMANSEISIAKGDLKWKKDMQG